MFWKNFMSNVLRDHKLYISLVVMMVLSASFSPYTWDTFLGVIVGFVGIDLIQSFFTKSSSINSSKEEQKDHI